MVKSLLDTEYTESSSKESPSLKELGNTVALFDKTLDAFELGGVTTSPTGEDVKLAAVKDAAAVTAIREARKLWTPYKQNLDPIINNPGGAGFEAQLAASIQYAKNNNLSLLKYMNDLTVALERVASSKATTLRIIQTIGISLAILNFFIIMFHFVKQLRESDSKIEAARKETEEILDTVNEGLFLLNKDLKIGSQHSKQLVDMFHRHDLEGLSFEDLLRDIVSSKTLQTSERFVNLFYRKDINSKLIQDLNPLSEVEANFTTQDGDYTTRYFSFTFNRVYDQDEEITSILATVVDITEKVKLERELEESKKASEQQLELLTEILSTQPTTLKKFIDNCFVKYKQINEHLKRSAKTKDALIKNLDDSFTIMHRLKGDAGAIGLESFASLTHKIEDTISDLKNRTELNGDDFLPLIVEFEGLIRYTESIQTLTEKLEHFSARHSDKMEHSATAYRMLPQTKDWAHLDNFCKTVAHNNQKEVQLITSGLYEVSLDDQQEELLNSVITQGIRNAIVHGIETPEVRNQLGKAPLGRIDVQLVKLPDGTLELTMNDDGQGFDYDKIRDQAKKTGNWSSEDIDQWDRKKLVSLIFSNGFSTADNVSGDAGRGMGMNVIRNTVREADGKIFVSSRKNTYTKLVISIPGSIQTEQVA